MDQLGEMEPLVYYPYLVDIPQELARTLFPPRTSLVNRISQRDFNRITGRAM